MYDDYAHHPTEIKAALQAAASKFGKENVVAVFQPHRFTRLQSLWKEFLTAFENAGRVIVTDVYAASEDSIEGINGENFAAELSCEYVSGNMQDVARKLMPSLKKGDVVIGLGAMWFMGRNKSDSDSAASSQTEEQQEDAAADLVIKGDGDTADDAEPAEETDAEETEETEEAAPEEEEAEPEEPQTVTMKVNASSLNVRSEANTTSSVVTSLTNGDTVEVLGDASQEWVQIRCTSKNNEEGYVKSEYLVAAE